MKKLLIVCFLLSAGYAFAEVEYHKKATLSATLDDLKLQCEQLKIDFKTSQLGRELEQVSFDPFYYTERPFCHKAPEGISGRDYVYPVEKIKTIQELTALKQYSWGGWKAPEYVEVRARGNSRPKKDIYAAGFAFQRIVSEKDLQLPMTFITDGNWFKVYFNGELIRTFDEPDNKSRSFVLDLKIKQGQNVLLIKFASSWHDIHFNWRVRPRTVLHPVSVVSEDYYVNLMRDFPAAYHSISTYRDFDLNKYLEGDYASVGASNVLVRLSKAMLASNKDRKEINQALALPDSKTPEKLDVIERVSNKLLKRALSKTGKIAFVRRKKYGLYGTNATMFSRRTDAGAAICIYDPSDGTVKELFKTEKGFIFDIYPSFDGKKLLMSYKEDCWGEGEKQTFHIWEINVDGTGLRQITKGPWHDFTPVYYPDGRIVFSSTRVESFSVCQNFMACALYVCKADGSDIRRFDFTTLCTVSPALMSDGSIIASRWEYMDKTLFTWQGLWTIYPNGRQLKLYYGNTLMVPQALYAPKQIPDTDLVLYVMAGHHHPPVSDIAVVDRKLGVENPDATWKLTDMTSLKPRLGRDWQETRAEGDIVDYNAYSEPWPFSKELSVVSFGGNGSGRASLALLDHGGTTYPLYADPDKGCFSAVSLSPRRKPRAVPGDCPQEPGTGTFFVQDVYQGLLEQGVERGQVKKLRVFRQVPKKYNTEGPRVFDHYPVMGLGSYYLKEYYGTVPVDENGSAYFEVPSNVELYFIAVDEDGKEIQRMGSVTQITTDETVSCIGCHEDRLNAPKADRKAMKRLKRDPDKITPPSWGAGPIDYVKHIQPIWDRNCVKCHNSKEPKGGVDMTGDKTRFFNMSFDSLCMRDSENLGYFKNYSLIQYYFIGFGPGGVFPALKTGSRVSKLTEMLEKEHPASLSGTPGQIEVKLSRDELERVYTWIDANVPYYATMEISRPHSMGARDLFAIPKKQRAHEHEDWIKTIEAFLDDHDQKMTSASINFTNPELSRVLMRNLAKTAGGWADDEKALFKNKDDEEYKRILAALLQAAESLKTYPRMDMPGAVPIPQVRDFGRVL